MSIDIAISFDTTGSMYPCLTQVRRSVQDLTKTLFRDLDDLRIAVIAHGDYCDGKQVLTRLDFTRSSFAVNSFVKNVASTSGGDYAECYEYVLHETRSLAWKADTSRALVMIGDAVPHSKEQYRAYYRDRNYYDWKNEAKLLHDDMNVNVYAVQCLKRRNQSATERFWKGLAGLTEGYYLELDQFNSMPELLHAVAYKQLGNERLQQYHTQLVDQGRMTRNVDALFDTLQRRKPTVKRYGKRSRFSSVDPARFQALRVYRDTPIKQFVETNGARFNTGRGFYQFVKPVLVQEHKEVILKDRTTGDLYTGARARKMIGLAPGEKRRINPKDFDTGKYTAFIQSTSPNRKLLGGTEFLYEVEDWG